MSRYIKPPDRPYKGWKSGPPPSVGWWPASVSNDPQCLRYWDGKAWSDAAFPTMRKTNPAVKAIRKDLRLRDIRWAPKWWPEKGTP